MRIRWAAVVVSAVLLASCDNPTHIDYYSQIKDACLPALSLSDARNYIQEGELAATLKLPDECVDAIFSMVEWDDSFFVEPEDPVGFISAARARKDVIDVIYGLLAYPLELPSDPNQLHVLGIGSAVFPPDLLCAVLPHHFSSYCPSFSGEGVPRAENVNQAFFNYFFARVRPLKRVFARPESRRANANGDGSTEIYENFFERELFGKVGILLHEARHHDDIPHIQCWEGAGSEGRECDSDLGEMRGITILYSEALLHGSSQLRVDGLPMLDSGQRISIARSICRNLLVVDHLVPELERFRRDRLIEENLAESCSAFKIFDVLREFDPEVSR